MKRKHKIFLSAIIAIVLFATNAIIYAANKETSGKNSYLPIDLNVTEEENAEEPQIEEAIAEKPALSDLKNYFDTALYLPTMFPYDMECFQINSTDIVGLYTAIVDYCSPDQQKYISAKIQKAEKTDKEYLTLVFEDHAFEQNEVRIEDSTEMLYSIVKNSFIQALLIKDNMFYQFTGNLTTEELITVVESMELTEETSSTIAKEEFLAHMEEIGIRVKEMDSRELSFTMSLNKSSTKVGIIVNVQSIGGYASEVGMKQVAVRTYDSSNSNLYTAQSVEGFYNTNTYSSACGYTITNPVEGKAYQIVGTLYTIIKGVEYTYYIESDKYTF